MDNELREILFDLKLDSTVLRALINTILDSARLDYKGEDLTISKDTRILAIIRAFYEDEYNNRLNGLKAEKIAKDLGAKIEEYTELNGFKVEKNAEDLKNIYGEA